MVHIVLCFWQADAPHIAGGSAGFVQVPGERSPSVKRPLDAGPRDDFTEEPAIALAQECGFEYR